MTQVFDVKCNPIVALALDDGTMSVDILAAVFVASAAMDMTRYDLLMLNEIASQCGRTRRGAGLARAYLCDRTGR